jgi:hypothetical protein
MKLKHTNLIPILGFFVPKRAVKMKPSRAIIKNWENVIILPLDGSSLERKKIKLTEENSCCKVINLQIRHKI